MKQRTTKNQLKSNLPHPDQLTSIIQAYTIAKLANSPVYYNSILGTSQSSIFPYSSTLANLFNEIQIEQRNGSNINGTCQSNFRLNDSDIHEKLKMENSDNEGVQQQQIGNNNYSVSQDSDQLGKKNYYQYFSSGKVKINPVCCAFSKLTKQTKEKKK